MNRIEETFSRLKTEGKKAFIVYITAGYPGLEELPDIAAETARAGADIIELGIPFSDPLADGPTIQESSRRALLKGATTGGILKAVEKIRKRTSVPLVFMSYYNPVYAFGIERLAKGMDRAGVDGIIVPDLPAEECGVLRKSLDRRNIAYIPLAASNTPEERLGRISREATGFIYCLSHIGVTGAGAGIESGLGKFIGSLRRITEKPIAVGFGVSEPEHVRFINSIADGVIVGSAVIREIKKYERSRDLAKKIGRFVRGLKN